MTDGAGDMETVRTMRIEQLHRVLYTAPATENEVINVTLYVRAQVPSIMDVQHKCRAPRPAAPRGTQAAAMQETEHGTMCVSRTTPSLPKGQGPKESCKISSCTVRYTTQLAC